MTALEQLMQSKHGLVLNNLGLTLNIDSLSF
jgi:hypothetical protein